jgi:hypothetical protein
MGEINQNIQPSTADQKRPAKAADPLDELTPQQRIFLNLMVEGEAPQSAYVKAGYTGDPKHACYQLKSRLDKQLTMLAISRGMAKSDLVLGLKKLNELPILDDNGDPVRGISMQHKLRLMDMQARMLDSMKENTGPLLGISLNLELCQPAKPQETQPTGIAGEKIVDADVIQ